MARGARSSVQVEAFAAAARAFGPGAGEAKRAALAEAIASRPERAADVAALRSALDFVRAYPDDAATLRAARDAIESLPAAPPVRYRFSWGTVRRLVASHPDRIEIDWTREPAAAFCDTLDLLVHPCESAGLLDPDLAFEDWFARTRPARFATDLAYFVDLLERSGTDEPAQAHLFEVCGLPIVWKGPPSCAVRAPSARTAFRRRPFDRERFPLEPVIRTPLGEVVQGDRAWIETALAALCARELEIYPLLYASPDDVRVIDGGHGIRVAFVGMLPEFRSPLETIAFFLVTQNDAPVAYGPAGVLFGSCEMGINLFPEFRGAEIRRIYAQVMRGLHHLHGVERFWLTRYGMGEGNPEAIDSGAFWFYRRLGFVATEPAVERLAREEEARMTADPSHRSDRAMLRRLSHTEAHLDLSGGRRTPFPQAALSLAESRFIATEFGGDRDAAQTAGLRRIARTIGLTAAERTGWGARALAVTLSRIPDLGRWTRDELAALRRIVVAKGAACEAAATREIAAHARLESSLRALASA